MKAIHKFGPYALIALMGFFAYGSILFNGAGFSHPDDGAASVTNCCMSRPILAATYALNVWARGGWMLVNLMLHIAVGSLLYRISGSMLAALLFVCHPMAADSVASVAGRSALLSAVFVCVAILNRRHWKIIMAVAVPVVALTLGFAPSVMFSIHDAPTLATHAVNFTSAVGSYIVPAAFIPYGLSADPDISFAWTGIAMFVLILALSWSLVLEYPSLRIAVALLLLPLLPYWFVPLPDVFFEHRGYLSAAGACWLLSRIHLRQLQAAVPLAALAIFLLASMQRAEVYSSPFTLWQDAALKSPNKARPHMNYGVALAGAGRLKEAELEFKRTIRLDATIDGAWGNLARLAVERGDFSEASDILDAHALTRTEDSK